MHVLQIELQGVIPVTFEHRVKHLNLICFLLSPELSRGCRDCDKCCHNTCQVDKQKDALPLSLAWHGGAGSYGGRVGGHIGMWPDTKLSRCLPAAAEVKNKFNLIRFEFKVG